MRVCYSTGLSSGIICFYLLVITMTYIVIIGKEQETYYHNIETKIMANVAQRKFIADSHLIFLSNLNRPKKGSGCGEFRFKFP
jgi:hypothetical protein